MSTLPAAHQGYSYQDIFVACRLVDLLLDEVAEAHVDTKLTSTDRFDDLTTIDAGGGRERVQIKFTLSDPSPLSVTTFTNDSRRLRLDQVIGSVLADRQAQGHDNPRQLYRIVLCDREPTDGSFGVVLRQAVDDPGPLFKGLSTTRLFFDAEALWHQMHGSCNGEPARVNAVAGVLRRHCPDLSFADLVWVCSRLVIEIGAPSMSGDLTAPGGVEKLLLARLQAEVGAGSFPNHHRKPVDVAAAMIDTAEAARNGTLARVSREVILRRCGLIRDFGAVSRAHPVGSDLEVPRPTTIQRIVGSAESIIGVGGTLVVTGPPGQGKSWLSSQMLGDMTSRGWLVAEHYCYLGDADRQKNERVVSERIFGSLVGRLAETEPSLVESQLPRFAADDRTLIQYVERSISRKPDRPVALVIDGMDHITRVQAGRVGGFDPSWSLANVLASLEIPAGAVLIVLSQPGGHLDPLFESGAIKFELEGLGHAEISSLAQNLGLIPSEPTDASENGTSALEDLTEARAFVEVLVERSGGNALYATYLCRETLRSEATLVDPVATLRNLPPFDGTLENYYGNLYTSLEAEGGLVADLIGLLDFAVTRAELRDILTVAGHRIDRTLGVLKPVLVDSGIQGGVRIYHESFSRYLRQMAEDDADAHQALVEHVTEWLSGRGLFDDSRAFRSLLPLLASSGQGKDVIDAVDGQFVVRSVAAGFPTSAIVANLATAIGCAAKLGMWPVFARFVELTRAAESYEAERYETPLVEYTDVPIRLFGPSAVADRLLYEGQIAMSPRAGLRVCAELDANGAVAPWRQYMEASLREAESRRRLDEDEYDQDGDLFRSMEWWRGRLHLSASVAESAAEDEDLPVEACVDAPGHDETRILEAGRDLSAPINWRHLAGLVNQHQLPQKGVAESVLATHGIPGIRKLVPFFEHPGVVCLAVAQHLTENPEHSTIAGTAQEWATRAIGGGIRPGEIHTLLGLGVEIADLVEDSIEEGRRRLLDLTQRIQAPSNASQGRYLGEWLDACVIAACRDPVGLDLAEALIVANGWYGCWLRFAVELARAETAEPEKRAGLAVKAVRHLAADVEPLSGNPRAVDLMQSVRIRIRDNIRRAMLLVSGEHATELFELLWQVSTSVVATVGGTVAGPLVLHDLLRVALSSDNETLRRLAADAMGQQDTNTSVYRFYSDMAEGHLIGARLALAADNHEAADRHWNEACRMLVSYRHHKDLTIFELTQPLKALIAADRDRSREILARLQPLCYRTAMHTDGKETTSQWQYWWDLLAMADPQSLARIVANRLLSECNDPNWPLDEALETIWRLWWEKADPLLGSLLRLTLDTALDTRDPAAFSRLADHVESETEPGLLTWLLARADEQPDDYHGYYREERLARDGLLVRELNAIAGSAGLSHLITERQRQHTPDEQTNPQTPSTTDNSTVSQVAAPSSFEPGLVGVSQAIRAWRQRPYDTTLDEWSPDRFADAIATRLVEVAQNGQKREAELALGSLARAAEYGERSILPKTAALLEELGNPTLAAIAYTLRWFQTRREDTETNIDLLRKASDLDSEVALRVVADQTVEVVHSGMDGGYWTYGICRSLIYAIAVGALVPDAGMSGETAFALWDEVFCVIDDRVPRVGPADDPEDSYTPPDTTTVDNQTEIDNAFVLGIIAGLGHPGREKKRRTMLALERLMTERPLLVSAGLNMVLSTSSDPATVTRLLRLLENTPKHKVTLINKCKDALGRLASGEYLVIRALARRLLGSQAPPLPPPSPPNPAMVPHLSETLWTPTPSHHSEASHAPHVEYLVEQVAGNRISTAEQMVPGLRDAVGSQVAVAQKDPNTNRRCKKQLDAYGNRNQQHWPDAYLAPYQAVEEALQRVATGGRAARTAAGINTSDPIVWEDRLAEALLDDPVLPMAAEASRIPRPTIPHPPSATDKLWNRSPIGTQQQHPLFPTLEVRPPTATPTIHQGPFQNWRVIATVEDRLTRQSQLASEYTRTTRYRVIETRHRDDPQALNHPPVTEGDIRIWWQHIGPTHPFPPSAGAVPLLGLDRGMLGAGDAHMGLGIPSPLLTPNPVFVSLLNLQPAKPFVLSDDDGRGLVLLTWRSTYDTVGHSLPFPCLLGSAVIMRPDLFESVVDTSNRNMTLRDFIEQE